MEPATDGKSLEKRLKIAAVAWASTLTPTTSYSVNGVDIRGRREGQAAVDHAEMSREEGTTTSDWVEVSRKMSYTNSPSVKNNGVDIRKERKAATDQKNLDEKRRKEATLAWVCTLTPPTGFEHNDTTDDDIAGCLSDRVRRSTPPTGYEHPRPSYSVNGVDIRGRTREGQAAMDHAEMSREKGKTTSDWVEVSREMSYTKPSSGKNNEVNISKERQVATDEKSLERRLKVAALAWACTLTPPTVFEKSEPNDDESLECRVRRMQRGREHFETEY